MLMCPQTVKFDSLPEKTQALLDDFTACSADENAPKIVFVSKMIPVNRSQLPQNRAKMLTEEELRARRDAARERHQVSDFLGEQTNFELATEVDASSEPLENCSIGSSSLD